MRRLQRFVERSWQRFTFFFSHRYWLVVAIIGVILEAGAIVGWKDWQPWSAMIGGVGGSVLATVLVSFWGPAGDPVYQTFLRLGVTKFYRDRNRFPKDQWVRSLREANHRCILLGQAHGEWCTDHDFSTALRERIEAGVKIDIFFLDPTGLAATVRHNEDKRRLKPLKSRIRASIKELWSIREMLKPEVKNDLKLYVYNATPSLGLTWIDDIMLVTHYLAGFINLTAPLLRVEFRPVPNTLFSVYSDNVDEIRRDFSIPITDTNIHLYLPEVADE